MQCFIFTQHTLVTNLVTHSLNMALVVETSMMLCWSRCCWGFVVGYCWCCLMLRLMMISMLILMSWSWWWFLGGCSSHYYFLRGTTWVCSVIIIIIIIMSSCRTGPGWWHNTSEARTWCSPAAPSRPYCKNRLPSSPLFFAWSLCIRICWVIYAIAHGLTFLAFKV